MGQMARIERPQLPPGRRVLVLSDVHGCLGLLKGVLDQAGYGPDDILIFLGDLVEKGPDSLATLRWLMDLAARRTVYFVRGNCDDLAVEFVKHPAVRPEFFHHYLNIWRDRSLLLQMGRLAGFLTHGPEDLPGLRQVILAHYQPELAFLDAMPHVLLTPDYLFVHGGVPDEDKLNETPAWTCMKNDFFLDQGHTFRRWCVVGHTPVTLYRPEIPASRPLVAERPRIVSIDGGCGLQPDAQLNALVLPQAPGGAFTWFAYDGLPAAVALDGQEESPSSVNIRWGHNLVKVAERGEALCRCFHPESGRLVDIPTGFLYASPQGTRCKESTDYRPKVSPGDRLSVIWQGTDRALVKKDGVTGWYFGRLEPVREKP
ncbi:metallophosphoesterase [Pseudoflavonifractor phocaeensis]|nr:metallophosphoesterase [Pseudoflavonifractor phocaeensis]